MDTASIDAALAILEKEQTAVRRADRFLRRTLFSYLAVLALTVGLFLVAAPILEPKEKEPSLGAVLLVVAACLGFLALLPALALALAGRLRSAFHLTRGPRVLLRALDRLEVGQSLSALRQVGTRTLLSGLGAIMGLLLLMAGGIGLIGVLSDRPVEPLAFVAVAFVGVAGAVLVGADFRRHHRDVRDFLERSGHLERSLRAVREGAAAGAESEAISVRDWNQIARMEREQIGRERLRAVSEGLREAASESYSVVKSPDLIEATASLDARLRLRLEDEAQGLSRAPRPREALLDAESGLWHLRVPDTPLELSYAIDEEQHRIRLMQARAVDDA